MFHMLTCFDLRPEFSIAGFEHAVKQYEQHMLAMSLVRSMGPVGERQRDTIMDTDEGRDHQYFFISSFDDRKQCDRAVDYIYSQDEPGKSLHEQVFSKVRNQVFTCWQDI